MLSSTLLRHLSQHAQIPRMDLCPISLCSIKEIQSYTSNPSFYPDVFVYLLDCFPGLMIWEEDLSLVRLRVSSLRVAP